MDEVSDPWDMAKDGKMWLGLDKEDDWYKRGMRK